MQEPRAPLSHRLHDYFFPHARNDRRPHLFSAMSVAVLVLAVIFLEAGYLAQTRIVFLKTDFLASVLPGALVALTNQDRAAEGLVGVTEDAVLDAAAQAAAEDMATKGYFAHVSPDGKAPWYWLDQAGYRYRYAGQNLAVHFTDSEEVETAWMASPAHRANIVKQEYTRVGFGTAHGAYEGRETTFVVAFLATPAERASETVPASVTFATPPSEPASAAPVQVLGAEAEGEPASLAPTPASPGWFARALAAPLSIATIVLTMLFAVISVLLALAIFMRGREQHPTVVIGGMLLLAVISGSMLVSAQFAGDIRLPADTQAASVVSAFEN